MSRIGYKAIELPQGVEVSQSGNIVTVKGPKGTLSREISPLIKMNVTDSEVTFERENDDKKAKMVHGTTRANVNNMIEGVVNGFKKTLKLVGVGYRAQAKGSKLILTVGYSKWKSQKIWKLTFQTTRRLKSAVSTKNTLANLLPKFVPFVHQSLTRVRVFVTKMNTSCVRKVRLVSNRLAA